VVVSSSVRATLVVLVLAVAGVVALWPRTGGQSQQSSLPSAPSGQPAADLAALRARAALAPCPSDRPGNAGAGRAGVGPAALSGVRTTCLGDGSSVDLGAALAGRPVLINVWASWCAPCQQELPVLAAYSSAPDAVPVLGVQVQSAAADGLDLLAHLGVHLPSVYDANGAVSGALHLPVGLPASYVVSPDGQVRPVKSPLVFATPDDVRLAVRKYLGAVT
jgi:thiol-disulfide isomerase/thioredoxin